MDPTNSPPSPSVESVRSVDNLLPLHHHDTALPWTLSIIRKYRPYIAEFVGMNATRCTLLHIVNYFLLKFYPTGTFLLVWFGIGSVSSGAITGALQGLWQVMQRCATAYHDDLSLLLTGPIKCRLRQYGDSELHCRSIALPISQERI